MLNKNELETMTQEMTDKELEKVSGGMTVDEYMYAPENRACYMAIDYVAHELLDLSGDVSHYLNKAPGQRIWCCYCSRQEKCPLMK